MSNPFRIPFEVAISEPKLLKPRFEELSLPQQVALKIAYGCQLSGEVRDDRGWSELDYWAVSQECCEYDDFGYVAKITRHPPYDARAYRETWAIWGIRAGKTDGLATFAVCYEATCGGHEAFVRRGRPAICFLIAQDLRMSKYALHGIKTTVESMPLWKSGIVNVTADRVELKNGVTIATTPPTVKSIRGYDAPVAVLDEVGVWYQDADSANPDFEIYRQVSSRQAQFEDPKIIGISSPWNAAGLLFQRWEAGTDGRKLTCVEHRKKRDEGCSACRKVREPHQGVLIMHGTTAGLGNPLIRLAWLQEERNKDPQAFERECLAKFQSSVSGFLPYTLIQTAIDRGITERKPEARNFYVAAIDPAFRQDAFALAIGHADESHGIVIDLLRRWLPSYGVSLNPEVLLDEIVPILKAYGVALVSTDQYQFESFEQLGNQKGLAFDHVRFTATSKAGIYGNLKTLLHQQRIRLLDDVVSIRELGALELKRTHGGLVQISAPEGQHDDMATVIALVAHKAVWLLPDKQEEAKREPTPFETCNAQIAKTRKINAQMLDDLW